VLFVDASLSAEAPFTLRQLEPKSDSSFTTHSLAPEAVMQVYADLHDADPPLCHLLAIRGERFDLGESLSGSAAGYLEAAIVWAQSWLAQATQFVTK
jgi:hydrogenase maturation protease